jgi:hypothetical protein
MVDLALLILRILVGAILMGQGFSRGERRTTFGFLYAIVL